MKALKLVTVTNDVFADLHKHYITIFVQCERKDAAEDPQVRRAATAELACKAMGLTWPPDPGTGKVRIVALDQLGRAAGLGGAPRGCYGPVRGQEVVSADGTSPPAKPRALEYMEYT